MMREIFLGFLGKHGILLDRYVADHEINEILQSLRPVNSGYELIRVGSESDGGYLLPDVLEGMSACFSPGVATNSSFEWELAEMGIECFLADNSVDGPPQVHPKFNFIKKHLDSITGSSTITLSAWLDMENSGGDLILQMDIEGSEYAVLDAASLEELSRFRVIIVEFHEFDSIVTVIGNRTIKNTLNRLRLNHSIVHVHANNFGTPRRFRNKKLPRGMELTLLRNDYVLGSGYVNDLPNSLDKPNSLVYPEIELDHNWFK